MKYFKFREIIKSSKADKANIDNFPNDCEIVDNIIYMMELLDNIREKYGQPLYISSGYRCDALNDLVGGSKTSMHTKGLAVDINLGSKTKNRQFFRWMQDNKDEIIFDQLINESDYSWVHVGFRSDPTQARKQVLHL